MDKYGIKENVIFHNHLSKEQMDENLRRCTLVIINKPDNKRNSYNFATKLGEYMSYGIPIISSDVGDSKLYLQDGVNSLIVPSTDVDGLVEKIGYILDNPDEAIRIGNNGRATAVRSFDYLLYSSSLRQFFRDL
jgi:glycosyltransferase involved in cell wall biosynthesis